MKRIITTVIVVLACIRISYAQNYAEFYVTSIADGEEIYLCDNEFDGAIIYGRTECEQNQWQVNGEYIYADYITINHSENDYFGITHLACGQIKAFGMYFVNSQINNPFTEPIIWKRQGESVTLTAGIQGGVYTFLWSNGATSPEIQVTQPGIYYVTLTSVFGCGSETFSVEVRDNVEISLATCDLETNHNMVTWPVTAAQAQYIDHLRIIRDGMEVGTANYSDGFFLDAIGSDAASRTYTLIAVATDGTECPIVSYPKETIHMAYLTGVNNTIEVNWNVPTGYDLLGYNICEWHPGSKDGDLTIIDYVGAGVTSYTCSESMFDQGNVVIQGVEAGKSESRLLSNRSWETVGLGEQQNKTFKLYPNPSSGTFTVEGATTLTIYNTLGQIITTSKAESNVHTFTLARGIYFVKSDEGTVKKVVVE